MERATTAFDAQPYRDLFTQVAGLRAFRATVVDEVRSGALSVDELLERSTCEDAVAEMSVLPWFEAVPGVGKVASRRTLEAIGVADTARTRDLTAEQTAHLKTAVAQASS